MNPKIALEVGSLHQIRRSVFPRAEIPEELIWNSDATDAKQRPGKPTHEKEGKFKRLAMIWKSCFSVPDFLSSILLLFLLSSVPSPPW
jgi:hypothetical protein